MTELVAEVAQHCGAELDGWTGEFRERYGAASLLQTLPRRIRREASRLLRSLG